MLLFRFAGMPVLAGWQKQALPIFTIPSFSVSSFGSDSFFLFAAFFGSHLLLASGISENSYTQMDSVTLPL